MKDAASTTTANGFSILVVGLVCTGLLLAGPAAAGEDTWLTTRRGIGLAFLGGSAVLVGQGFDFRNEANRFYQRYKEATAPEEIERMYQRTNNQDTKSQLCWALAAACAISGIRLILTTGPESPPQPRVASRTRPHGPGRLELSSHLLQDGFGLSLRRRFP